MGGVGNEHGGAFFADVAEIGRSHQQGRHFAVGPGRRLQRNGRQSGDFGQHVLSLMQQEQKSLHGRIGLIWMQIDHARHVRKPLVPLGIVLHRARAERIEVRIDRHVICRQIGEVPDHVDFGKFRQRRRHGRNALQAAIFPAVAEARRSRESYRPQTGFGHLEQ